MPKSIRRSLVPSARVLRQRETPSEKLLWSILRNRQLHGLKFRRQYPVGPFVADFYCAEYALIVELDGPIHDQFVEQDAYRTQFIESGGYRVIRFRNEELMSDPDGVLQRIIMATKQPSPDRTTLTPNPSPFSKGEGSERAVPSPSAEGEGGRRPGEGRLQNRVALITGGGSGIGRATALLFAKEGAKVMPADRYLDRAEETVSLIKDAGGEATAAEVDVADAAKVEAMVKQAVDAYGRVDILMNNAGISAGNDILTIDEATWDLNLNIVLKGVFLCSKAVLPGMIERGQGVIINISSVNGLYGIGEEPYSAAKAGMINLTQNMAVKYGPKGVRVNCICPGSIETPIWAERVKEEPRIFEKLAKWYPLRRVGQPEDVANAALFLASDEASWITGAILPVDGGLTAGNEYLGSDLGS